MAPKKSGNTRAKIAEKNVDSPKEKNLRKTRKGSISKGSVKKVSAPDAAQIEKLKTEKTFTNPISSDYKSEDFTYNSKGEYNFKISSWNVSGLRAWIKKDNLQFIQNENPDILCLQETKCSEDQLPAQAAEVKGYYAYWFCQPGGYAGVAVYTKIKPIDVRNGIGDESFDKDGRIMTLEYEKFYLVNVYVPNSGRKLVNLDSRMVWEDLFLEHVKKLDSVKPVIICGDMNVAHKEIDLANPKSNTRNAGFTDEERNKMSNLLSQGFIDTFRKIYPDKKDAYTFWTYLGNARKRNVGWRIDYFILSKRLISSVKDNCIRSQCFGSDHCPITLFLKL